MVEENMVLVIFGWLVLKKKKGWVCFAIKNVKAFV